MRVETVRGRGRPRYTLDTFAKLLMATVQEIFDEAAYSRFLKRKRVARSHESYAEFVRESDSTKARLPRCC